MKTIVDSSVWSLAFRRKRPPEAPEVDLLAGLIRHGEAVLTGAILQEVLQGIRSDEQFARLEDGLASMPLLSLTRRDYSLAARVWTRCRTGGIQVTPVDAQIAAAAANHDCPVLTTDRDFDRIAAIFPLKLLHG
jgi:predicted nucleic acid-binding protein